MSKWFKTFMLLGLLTSACALICAFTTGSDFPRVYWFFAHAVGVGLALLLVFGAVFIIRHE